MQIRKKSPFVAALVLNALPALSPAGEAPAASAVAREAERAAAERSATAARAMEREVERALADAQRRLEAASREVAELSRQMGRNYSWQINTAVQGGQARSLLGVNVERASGRDGARVMDVSPGGAAAAAGIKAGDIITGIADLDLTKDSNPGSALVEKMQQLEPEQKVKVAVLRDGRKLSFDVTPRAAPQNRVPRIEIPMPGQAFRSQPGQPGQPGQRGQGQPEVRMLPRNGELVTRIREMVPELRSSDESGARFDGAEFASLSERLGGYFGVTAGVLVVRAGVDSSLKLQDGDVILAIDGREATTAQQAGRILRSYQPGEKLALKVQRDRKNLNIDAIAPGGARRN